MAAYDTFILTDPSELTEGQELVTVLRDLTPGKKKYTSAYARIRIAFDAKKYPHSLLIRLGQGQVVDKTYSMEILSWIDPIPEGL